MNLTALRFRTGGAWLTNGIVGNPITVEVTCAAKCKAELGLRVPFVVMDDIPKCTRDEEDLAGTSATRNEVRDLVAINIGDRGKDFTKAPMAFGSLDLKEKFPGLARKRANGTAFFSRLSSEAGSSDDNVRKTIAIEIARHGEGGTQFLAGLCSINLPKSIRIFPIDKPNASLFLEVVTSAGETHEEIADSVTVQIPAINDCGSHSGTGYSVCDAEEGSAIFAGIEEHGPRIICAETCAGSAYEEVGHAVAVTIACPCHGIAEVGVWTRSFKEVKRFGTTCLGLGQQEEEGEEGHSGELAESYGRERGYRCLARCTPSLVYEDTDS